MEYLISAILFILIFSVLILIHEFGHFIVAKRNGIKVEEFGLGLPPRAVGKKKGETLYSLNWIPFGGFVRMLGEDSFDKKVAKNPRSFAAQSPWVRIKVVTAGVVMNFLLAWFLLAIIFSFGGKPLLTADEFLPALNDGRIEMNLGVKVNSVEEGSIAEANGFMAGDEILSVNGEYITMDSLAEWGKEPGDIYAVVRDRELFNIELQSAGELGMTFGQFETFPRIEVSDLQISNPLYLTGLREGDLIMAVNDMPVFNEDSFMEALECCELDLTVFDGVRYKRVFYSSFDDVDIVVSSVQGNAQEAGVRPGDLILGIDDQDFSSLDDLIAYIGASNGAEMIFEVERDGQVQDFALRTNEEGFVGLGMVNSSSYDYLEGLNFISYDLVANLEVQEVRYSVPVAIYKSFGETFKLSKATAGMFADFLGGLVVGEGVPAEVSGPVGIATMTHGFAQEGWIALLTFMAVLSLSLAAINILPIPALDGGRLLFILVEVFTGKKIDRKTEAIIHMSGYVLILALILFVTYNDILRLF